MKIIVIEKDSDVEKDVLTGIFDLLKGPNDSIQFVNENHLIVEDVHSPISKSNNTREAAYATEGTEDKSTDTLLKIENQDGSLINKNSLEKPRELPLVKEYHGAQYGIKDEINVKDNATAQTSMVDIATHHIGLDKQPVPETSVLNVDNSTPVKSLSDFSLDSMVLIIKIIKNTISNYNVNIGQLGINYDTEKAALSETLAKFIMNALGFDLCKLSGLNVKDEDGQKIKPIIDIYIKKTILFHLPKHLKFTKDRFKVSKAMITQKLVFRSSSLILQHLLDNTTLNFLSDDMKQYTIEKDKGSYIIHSYAAKPCSVMDSIVGFSAYSEISRIIESYNANFTNLLRTIISGPDKAVEIKNFYKKITRNLRDVEYAYLCDVVTHSPTFFDSRDNFMVGLEKFLNADSPFEDLGKSEYLEIKKMKVIKKGANIGIKKLLG